MGMLDGYLYVRENFLMAPVLLHFFDLPDADTHYKSAMAQLDTSAIPRSSHACR